MKIVDLSFDVSGRFAAKLMAMSGLDVIRPSSAAYSSDPADRYLDMYLNAGKHSVVLPESAMRQLLAETDVLFTTYDRGKHLGIDFAKCELSPGCVHVTTSTFGAWGPYSRYRGGPLADWAAGGYLAITGEPDREPLKGPDTLCAYVGGYTAALAAEAGLLERMKTGIGRSIDVSTMEAMLCVHQSTFSRMGAGSVRKRTGRYAEVYPLTVLPCKQGYVSLGVVTDEEFDRLAIAVERPELSVDDRFASREARMEHRDALDAELADFLQVHDSRRVAEILQAGGVSAASVAEPSEVLSDPQLEYRCFWSVPDCDVNARMPGNPIPAATRFADSPAGSSMKRRPNRRSKSPEGPLPLSGLTVLDFTAFWAGPSATRCLADLGADVIWIEKPASRIYHEPDHTNPQALMQYLHQCKMHRGKKSIVLDLTTREGRDQVWRLAACADVIMENFRPGTAEKLGVGPQELCSTYPGLVYISLSGYGASGPRRHWGSYGPNLEAASSVMARTGYVDGPPMRLGHTLPDGVGGLQGALAALRGLRERQENGLGGWFDLSQLEAYTAMSGEEILSASLGMPHPRQGNGSPASLIQGVYPCRGTDQWIALRLADYDELQRLARVIGDSRLLDIALADVPMEYIETRISDYTMGRDKHVLTRELQRRGLEAMAVLAADDLVANPHLHERGFFAVIPVAGKNFVVPGVPIRTKGSFTATTGVPPRFGEHTRLYEKTPGLEK